MDESVKGYWLRLLDDLYAFAQHRIALDKFRTRLSVVRSELGEHRVGFTTGTPFDFVVLSSAILSAFGEISPESAEDGIDPHEVARELFDYYWDVIVLGQTAYLHPKGASVFGAGACPVILEGQSVPARVGEFLHFAREFVYRPAVLEPGTVQSLHSLYQRLTPDTVLGILCMQAVEILLPWLNDGMMPSQLETYETRSWELALSTVNRFQECMRRLDGEDPFVVVLRYYRGQYAVQIEDWQGSSDEQK